VSTSQTSTYPMLTEDRFRIHADTESMSSEHAERAVSLYHQCSGAGAEWPFRLAVLFQEAVGDGKVGVLLPELETSFNSLSSQPSGDRPKPYDFYGEVRARAWEV